MCIIAAREKKRVIKKLDLSCKSIKAMKVKNMLLIATVVTFREYLADGSCFI